MIVTSVIVLAIAGSALAFKVKGGAWCITTNLSSFNCTTYVQNKQTVVFDGTQYRHAPFWDGNKTAYTAANNGLCTSPTPLIK